MKPGIIFDMDGTLWDSSEGVAKSWTEIVNKEYDKERVITAEDIQGVMGRTMDKIADALFAELSKEDRMSLLRKCCDYENEYLRIHGGVLYPELEETFKALQDEYDLFIVSNCQAGYIEAFLGYYGIAYGTKDDLVEDIECYGNNFLQKDENIRLLAERNKLTAACYVGDIQSDYDATMKAGLPFIHAKYGFGTIDAEVPVINSFAELIDVIPEVIG